MPENLQLPGQVFDVPERNHLSIQEVSFVNRTTVKEIVNPGRVIVVFERDFNDHDPGTISSSEEDLRFLKKLKDSIRQRADGHFEMPLPFRGERPFLPYNKEVALNFNLHAQNTYKISSHKVYLLSRMQR